MVAAGDGNLDDSDYNIEAIENEAISMACASSSYTITCKIRQT